MEKKRRARINVSLEQLKTLLEKHYSHQIRKRKLEKADILELSVKYMKSLQTLQGLWPVSSGAEFASCSRGCLPGVSLLLRRREECTGGLSCPRVPERPAGCSTMDSGRPGPEAPSARGPCAWARWAPASSTGGPPSTPPLLLLPGDLPGSSPSVLAPPPASRSPPESPGPGLRVWRPW
ncbi:transcription factor HES-3 [Ochotona curzoniae]|uniref:transcription factor HES-3 n=1 Tax=Ochotona curzoniae TaxID=130825 RepID=UPI001B35327D|nr:transcription factor HES-3 [Ochotona curzoniae]